MCAVLLLIKALMTIVHMPSSSLCHPQLSSSYYYRPCQCAIIRQRIHWTTRRRLLPSFMSCVCWFLIKKSLSFGLLLGQDLFCQDLPRIFEFQVLFQHKMKYLFLTNTYTHARTHTHTQTHTTHTHTDRKRWWASKNVWKAASNLNWAVSSGGLTGNSKRKETALYRVYLQNTWFMFDVHFVFRIKLQTSQSSLLSIRKGQVTVWCDCWQAVDPETSNRPQTMSVGNKDNKLCLALLCHL